MGKGQHYLLPASPHHHRRRMADCPQCIALCSDRYRHWSFHARIHSRGLLRAIYVARQLVCRSPECCPCRSDVCQCSGHSPGHRGIRGKGHSPWHSYCFHDGGSRPLASRSHIIKKGNDMATHLDILRHRNPLHHPVGLSVQCPVMKYSCRNIFS